MVATVKKQIVLKNIVNAFLLVSNVPIYVTATTVSMVGSMPSNHDNTSITAIIFRSVF